MEPATLYLALVAVTAVVWLAGGWVWTLALWTMRRGARPALGVSRLVSVTIALVVLATSGRLSPAVAEVIPQTDRVIAAEDASVIVAGPALTFISMVEAAEPTSSWYTVRSGDCLWSIARSTIVADGVKPNGALIASLWRRIYDLNADLIGANPRLIFPGQVLDIPAR